MEVENVETIELCRRILTSPVRQSNPRWGDDFIAHRLAEHPEIQEEIERIRQARTPRLPTFRDVERRR
jgi:hypothetical protein